MNRVLSGYSARGLLVRDVVIPPCWLKQMQSSAKKDKNGIRNDMESLRRLDFERLVGCTGVMIHQRAKEKVVVADHVIVALFHRLDFVVGHLMAI